MTRSICSGVLRSWIWSFKNAKTMLRIRIRGFKRVQDSDRIGNGVIPLARGRRVEAGALVVHEVSVARFQLIRLEVHVHLRFCFRQGSIR